MAQQITINGWQYSMENAEWRQPEHRKSLADCDAAATKIGMPHTGQSAVQHIVDYVRANGHRGPVWGTEIVKSFQVPNDTGSVWTTFFKYACNNHDLLRYKKMPVCPSSYVFFIFPDQLSGRTTFDVPGPRPKNR